MKTLITWVRLLTTTKDNMTPDVIRIGGILIGAQFMALAAINWSTFDPVAFAGGGAALLAGIAASLRFKQTAEPDVAVQA